MRIEYQSATAKVFINTGDVVTMYTPKNVVWEERFSTGDKQLDFQHKHLLDTFNSLGEAISKNFEGENVNVALGRLRFYADWHFSQEEECMHQYACPAGEINKKAHKNFLAKLDSYQDKFRVAGGSQELALEIHEDLLNWLTSHILNVDTQLRGCILNS